MCDSDESDDCCWPRCTCNRNADSETSDDDDHDDSSFIEEESDNESFSHEKFYFICIYKNDNLNDTIIISSPLQIEMYRLTYSNLTNKSVANVKNIWNNVLVTVPMLGLVTLKVYTENLFKESIEQKKKLKRQYPRLELKNTNDNNFDKLNNINAGKSPSTAKLEKGKENLKEVNNYSNKTNIDKKVEEVKANSKSQSEDKKTIVKNDLITNIKKEKSSINNKILQAENIANKNAEVKSNVTAKSKGLDNSKNQTPVNNTKLSANKAQMGNSTLVNNTTISVNKDQKTNATKDSKNQTPVNNKKSTANKDQTGNSTSVNNITGSLNKDQKTNTTKDSNQTPANNTKLSSNKVQKNNSTLVNNITAAVNKKEQKSNSTNNTLSKINLEKKNENKCANKNENNCANKNENKSEEKSKPANQNSTPKKSDLVNKNENTSLPNGVTKTTNTMDKVLKIDTTKQSNKNEIKNSADVPKTQNVAEKKDLANTPSKKANAVDKNKQTNSIANSKDSTKSTESEFKKPQVEKIIDKVSKKKLKKQKQKEKKMERNRTDSSNCSSIDMSDNNSSPGSINKKMNKMNKIISQESKKTEEKQKEKQVKNINKNNTKVYTEESEDEEDEDQSEFIRTSDDDAEFLTDNENLPVFLAKLKEKSKKKEKNDKSKAIASTKINSNNTEKEDLVDNNSKQEFIVYSKKRSKVNNSIMDQNSIFYSETFGENACQMIFENNFIGALQYLIEAIGFNYNDQRHYLNRCYCYLSTKKNALALADAEYIIQTSTNIGYLFTANVRAAQASYGLQKYDQAEVYMNEAICLNPTSTYVHRELIAIQVARIVSMGFTEKDAVLALENYTSVQGAVNHLTENALNKSNGSKKLDFEITLENYDEFVYSSDEDEPSNAEIVNRMLNYEPGTAKFQHIVAKPLNPNLIYKCDSNKGMKKDKKIIQNKKANSEAIWVGNLTSSITDTMLKKKFKEFGKVVSIYRPLNEAYAFINFEKTEDATNVLINTPCHEIAGIKLLVKSAIRQK